MSTRYEIKNLVLHIKEMIIIYVFIKKRYLKEFDFISANIRKMLLTRKYNRRNYEERSN